MLPLLTLAGAFAILILLYLFRFRKSPKASVHGSLPAVPGWPLLGNLPQLKEKKPHKTFANWADVYGPIYSIRLGCSTVIVLNSTHVAKEAMVTKFSSISTRKLSKALNVLTQGKSMVATSDFDDFHKSVKRHLLASVVGPAAQKRFRSLRDSMMDSLSNRLREFCFGHPGEVVNFREIFEDELFSLSLKEALGSDVESIYVPEFKTTVSKKDMLIILVHDMMEGAIDVDWRDFFPFLSWVPNTRFENKIERVSFRRLSVMNALISQTKNKPTGGECYLKHLLENGQTLTEKQISMLVWEAIIEASDTTLVAVEWALFELAKNPNLQDRLYEELKDVCGGGKLAEEHLSELPYLNAVLHETLRKYSPAPIVPLRYVHEDTEIGGYKVAAGSEIAINIYGCNMDAEQWDSPQEWKPERFLNGKYVLNDLHKTMAFGAGKRACAGSLQAMLVGSMAIGRLIQEFRWNLSPGEEEDVDFLGLTTRKLHPLKALLKPKNP